MFCQLGSSVVMEWIVILVESYKIVNVDNKLMPTLVYTCN